MDVSLKLSQKSIPKLFDSGTVIPDAEACISSIGSVDAFSYARGMFVVCAMIWSWVPENSDDFATDFLVFLFSAEFNRSSPDMVK